jgi:hypothetical protein
MVYVRPENRKTLNSVRLSKRVRPRFMEHLLQRLWNLKNLEILNPGVFWIR